MNDIILDKFNEIISLIENSNQYGEYMMLKEKIGKDKQIIDLINDIKVAQKEIVRLKYNGLDYSEKDELINKNLSILNSYPIYVEYNYLQEDLNTSFQIIKNAINDYIDSVIN